MGFSASAIGSDSFAASSNASAGGTSSVAIGDGAATSITAANGVAIGTDALAVGTNSTATGSFSQASGAGSFAGSASAIAIGDASVALGVNATTLGTNGVAIGQGALAIGTDTTAIGSGANAVPAGSAAFGAGATATRANQQVFGTASTTYSTPGITSAASRSAQGAPTHLVTSNGAGDLAAYTFGELGLASSGDLGALRSDVGSLRNDVNRAFRKIDENTQGIAIAMAMGGLSLSDTKLFAVSANVGFYDDKQALAAQLAVRVAPNAFFSGGVGVGLNEGSQVGGRVGITAAW